MKQIKYSATKKSRNINVVITHQTHTEGDFGDNDVVFKARNGLILASNCWPEASGACVYLWGANKSMNSAVLKMSCSLFKKFKEAIKEYNEFFADKKPQSISSTEVLCLIADVVLQIKDGWPTIIKNRYCPKDKIPDGVYYSFREKE